MATTFLPQSKPFRRALCRFGRSVLASGTAAEINFGDELHGPLPEFAHPFSEAATAQPGMAPKWTFMLLVW